MNTEVMEPKTRDWDVIFNESEYSVMSEFIKLHEKGEFELLGNLMRKYRSELKRSEELHLKLQLNELMLWIMLWKYDETSRIIENVTKILDLRSEINMSVYLEECLSEDTLKNIWKEAFEMAKDTISFPTKNTENLKELTWDEVFNEEFSLICR